MSRPAVDEEIWQALLNADIFIEGEFVFASGAKATIKADMERLYSHPKQLEIVMEHFASHPAIQQADVLMYVPEGMREFITMLGRKVSKPVAHAMRKPGSTSRHDFMFKSQEDSKLALSAARVCIGEDVVTTLGSVAALRKLLPQGQEVQSLAILLRGEVEPKNRQGLRDHYLLKREIPLTKEEFRQRLKDGWA